MKLITLLFLIVISFCNENKKTKEGEIIETVQSEFKLLKSDYVIFDYQPNWHWTFSKAKPTQLSQDELIEIEQILNTAIEEHGKIQKNKVIEHNRNNPIEQITKTEYEIKLKGYKRQYVPVITKEGQKEVWINFFCDAFGENWTTKLILVDDGGNCYYNIKINLTTKKYYRLEVNYAV